MNVDVHRHIIVPEITREADPSDAWRPRVVREGGAQIVEFAGRTIRSAVREFVRIDPILTDASELGVDHVLLSPWVSLLPYDLGADDARRVCAIQNAALAAIVSERPNRVSALGAVALQDPEAAAGDLRRAMANGLSGVEVAASVRGAYLGDDRFASFWEAVEAAGAVVLVHPTTKGLGHPVFDQYYLWNTVANPLETAISAAHLVMAGVLERHPELRIVLAHGGGALPSTRGRLRHAHAFQPEARSRLRTSPDDSLRRFWYDTVTHDAGLLRELVEFAGAERVLLGSDHPFDMGTSSPVEDVRAAGLPPEQTDAVLGGNAMRLLGLEAPVGPARQAGERTTDAGIV